MTTINSFADLLKVGKELKKQAAAIEAEKKKAAEAADRRTREAREFSNAMRDMGVEPLAASPRADKGKKKLPPIPRQTIADRKAVLDESISDDVDTLIFLQSEDGLCYWREGLSPDLCRKLRRGEWTVQNHIDLHGLRSDPARSAVLDFLRSSQKQGARCVRIVHGKGYGSPDRQPVLKGKVRRWLKQCDSVMAFSEAPEIDGGAGAVLVLLAAAGKNPSGNKPL